VNDNGKYAFTKLLRLALSVTLTNTTANSDCQTTSGQIPADKPEQGIDDYGGKDFEKSKVLQ